MVTTYLFSILLILSGVGLSRVTHLNLAKSAFFILNLWIALSFFITFFFSFQYAIYGILLASSVILIISVLKKRNVQKLSLKYILLDFVNLIFIFVVMNRMITSEFKLISWDEFSSWGANVKVFHSEGHFWNVNSSHAFMHDGYFLTYPPASTLVESIFAFGGEYSEIRVLYGLLTFLILGVLSVATSIIKHRNPLDYLVILLSFGVSYQYGFFLNNLYTDYLMGVLFLSALVLILENRAGGKISSIFVGLIMTNLILLKPNAVLLVLILQAILVAKSIRIFKNPAAVIRVSLIKSFLICLPSYMAFLLWKIHTSQLNIQIGNTSYFGTGRFREGSIVVLRAFFDEMNKPLYVYPSQLSDLLGKLQIPPGLSMNQLFLTLAITTVLAVRTGKNSTAGMKMAGLWGAIFVIFQVSMFAVYVAASSVYEGSRVASLSRYNSTIFCAWTLWLFFIIWTKIRNLRKVRFSLPIAFCVLSIYSFPQPAIDHLKGMNLYSENSIYSYQQEANYALNLRNKIESLFESLPVSNSKDKIYFVDQGTTGLSSYMFNYIALPNQSNNGCWSIGEKSTPSDVWTCPGDLSTHLKDYKYLVVLNGDSQFWRDNLRFLDKASEKKSKSIYQVVWKDDVLTLKGIPNTL